jgi:DNA polymerase-3 subunit alpha
MARFKEPAQLHNHSKYSLLDAVPSPEEWVGWCLETGTPALAVTDHGTAISMYDALRTKEFIKNYNENKLEEFGDQWKKTNPSPTKEETKEYKAKARAFAETQYKPYPLDAVTLIPAVELYVKLNAEDKSHFHITAWAATTEGYHNLMKLSSLAYNDTVSFFGSMKARVTFNQIKQYKKGIKFGTGCIAGPIGKAFWDGNKQLAEERFLMYRDLFGEDLYIEFHCNDVTHNFNKKTGSFDPIPGDECSCDGNKQKGYNQFLREMVDKYGGKCIPVTDAHFISPEDKIIQDCLLKNGNSNGWYFYESYHQLRAEQMYDKLRVHLGEWLTEEKFTSWIENTYQVADSARSISVKFEYHLPKVAIPEHIQEKTSDYDKQTYYLMMDLIKEHGRWNNDPVYVARFKQEVDVIMKNEKLNFIPYFLMYEDIGRFARSQGILQNIARGSAGGSLLSFYLKIIHVDPIKANLPFERFLSHARIRAGSFPDIDADIGDRARSLIMKYLREKYGLGFAQIATFQKMKTKNAIKDAMFAIYGRNRNDFEVKAICDDIPDSPQGVDEHDFLYGGTDQEGNYNAGQVEVNKNLANFFATYPDVEQMVKKLIGTIRGWSRHASAFVISTLDLSAERIPTMIMKDKELGDLPVTQYDATMVEKCGLVKADILGIKTLTAVSDCIKLVKDAGGPDYLEEVSGMPYIYRLPEDKGVYTDFYNKDTDSSFQFNTELIKGYIQEFCPLKRGDLMAMTALCRPGALDAPLYDTTAAQYYMDIRNGVRDIEFLNEDLRPILETHNGVFVYQEEVMRFLVEIAGYTWEESDLIRGAIAKKKHEVIMNTFSKIRVACKARGWEDEAIETVCQQIQAFSRYSFNKSHSYAYGELGYITMYLKHHHPLQWWASTLNSNADDEVKMRKYISKLGDVVRPPSLKYPTNQFDVRTIDGKEYIVTPLSAIKGVGPAVVKELCSKGPFPSVADFIKRIDHAKVNSGGISYLVKGRAADDMMDMSIPDYADRRKAFIDTYSELRGKKIKLQPDIFQYDPLSIFLMEKEHNQAFNKHLLSNPDIINVIKSRWQGLTETGRAGVPLMMGKTPVISNIKVAEGLIKKGHEAEVGMILLFESSEFSKGISKKSGRPWKKVAVYLSDGYSTIECTEWDRKAALGWDKNSIVYVRGTLKQGWKTPTCLQIKEIERIE